MVSIEDSHRCSPDGRANVSLVKRLRRSHFSVVDLYERACLLQSPSKHQLSGSVSAVRRKLSDQRLGGRYLFQFLVYFSWLTQSLARSIFYFSIVSEYEIWLSVACTKHDAIPKFPLSSLSTIA